MSDPILDPEGREAALRAGWNIGGEKPAEKKSDEVRPAIQALADTFQGVIHEGQQLRAENETYRRQAGDRLLLAEAQALYMEGEAEPEHIADVLLSKSPEAAQEFVRTWAEDDDYAYDWAAQARASIESQRVIADTAQEARQLEARLAQAEEQRDAILHEEAEFKRANPGANPAAVREFIARSHPEGVSTPEEARTALKTGYKASQAYERARVSAELQAEFDFDTHISDGFMSGRRDWQSAQDFDRDGAILSNMQREIHGLPASAVAPSPTKDDIDRQLDEDFFSKDRVLEDGFSAIKAINFEERTTEQENHRRNRS